MLNGKPTKERLISLDALRGLTMLCIIGLDRLATNLAAYSEAGFFQEFRRQLHHTRNSFSVYDLIFPLFLFISGATMPYSIGRRLEQGVPKGKLVLRALRRCAILIFLGLVYNGLFKLDFANLRYYSVLGLIGIAYFIGALIFLFCSVRGRILWAIGISVGYWMALRFIPVPCYETADCFTLEGSLTAFIDRTLLSGHLWKGRQWDPDGLLCAVSGSVMVILGALFGQLVKNDRLKPARKIQLMAGSGLLLLGAALLWRNWFPFVRFLWTSSIILYAAGCSVLLLAIFYLVIDVWKFRKWAFPFVLIGLNSITIYLCRKIIDFEHISNFFLKGLIRMADKDLRTVLLSAGVVVFEILFLYILYRKKMFLHV